VCLVRIPTNNVNHSSMKMFYARDAMKVVNCFATADFMFELLLSRRAVSVFYRNMLSRLAVSFNRERRIIFRPGGIYLLPVQDSVYISCRTCSGRQYHLKSKNNILFIHFQ
jgi:hypothetical protein